MLTAFNLSWELQKLAVRENEFCDKYATLSDQCGRYACDLLEQCRTSDEVTELLNHSGRYALYHSSSCILVVLPSSLTYSSLVCHPHSLSLIHPASLIPHPFFLN